MESAGPLRCVRTGARPVRTSSVNSGQSSVMSRLRNPEDWDSAAGARTSAMIISQSQSHLRRHGPSTGCSGTGGPWETSREVLCFLSSFERSILSGHEHLVQKPIGSFWSSKTPCLVARRIKAISFKMGSLLFIKHETVFSTGRNILAGLDCMGDLCSVPFPENPPEN